jgi:dTDP-4-dehydrorhamnose reductase
MRFLVIGANGLVGSRLCRQLVEQGHDVGGLGRGPRRVAGEFPYRTCELTDEQATTAAIAESKAEVIVNTASMTEVDACEKNPGQAFAANVSAAAFVAKGARATGAHLVHVSTDYVFDGDAGPYDEEALPNPKGVYAITKHMGEQAVQVFAPGSAVARTAVVFGWPAAGRPNFGAWLVGALRGGQQVRLFQDQYVSPSLANNVAALLLELGERKLSGVWNTAGADVVNRVEFGEALCARFGLDRSLIVPVRMADAKLPSPRPARSGLKPDKVRRELKTKALGLAEALENFQREYLLDPANRPA